MPVVVPRVMSAVPSDAVTARDAVSGAGGGATLRAPLAAMRRHAGFDPGAVRDELAAEPHRVRRAGLLNVRRLSGGHSSRTGKNKGRQGQPAHKTHAAHELFLLRLRCRRAKLAGVAGAVDPLTRRLFAAGNGAAEGKFRLRAGLSGGDYAQ